jgi:hypothetical protein
MQKKHKAEQEKAEKEAVDQAIELKKIMKENKRMKLLLSKKGKRKNTERTTEKRSTFGSGDECSDEDEGSSSCDEPPLKKQPKTKKGGSKRTEEGEKLEAVANPANLEAYLFQHGWPPTPPMPMPPIQYPTSTPFASWPGAGGQPPRPSAPTTEFPPSLWSTRYGMVGT